MVDDDGTIPVLDRCEKSNKGKAMVPGEWTMVDEATSLLEGFCSDEGLTGAFAATRSGNYICGVLPEGQHRDTFVAMTAIIHGGAETTSMEMKKQLGHVTVDFSEGRMIVMSLGTKAILALIGQDIDAAMVTKAKDLSKKLEGHIH
jgi:predicted regulator of Ras-like GTPase activity (Roadblock/LC7/MglB family)